MSVRIRAKENVCLICGAVSDGRKLITAEKAGGVFQVEIPLCNQHKDTPDQDLLKAVEISLEKNAEQLHQGAGLDMDYLSDDSKKQAAVKFKDAPCLLCDRPDREHYRKVPYGVKMAFVPLCQNCMGADEETLIQSMGFADAAYNTRPSRSLTLREQAHNL